MRSRLALLLALCVSASATITKVQNPAGVAVSTAACAITISANGTGAQRLLVVKGASNGLTITGVSGGGVWTLCGTNCRQTDGAAGGVDAAYLNAPTSSVTTITVTFSATGSNICWAEEYSTDQASFAFDVSGKVCDISGCTSTCTTACSSPTLSLTGTNDVITSIASCGGTCSGTITNYTTLYTSGDGSTFRVNTNSAAFNWNQSPGDHLVSASMAFKEVSSSGTTRRRASVIQSQ